jgi:hypothetical protein
MIYYGIMVSYTAGGDQFPPSVKNFNTFLKSIVPGLPNDQNRIMVSFPGSWVSRIGTSARNLAHAKWATNSADAYLPVRA